MVLKALHDDGSPVGNAPGRYATVSDIVDSRSEAASILDAGPTTAIRTDEEGTLEIVVCATEIPRGLFEVDHQLDQTILVALETDAGEQVFVITARHISTHGFYAFAGASDSVNDITLAVQGADFTGGTQAELEGQCPPRVPDE
jgi:hypothetical protein